MFIILYDENIRIKQVIKNNYKYKGIEISKIDDKYHLKIDYPYDFNDSLILEYKRYEIENIETGKKIIIYVYRQNTGIDVFNIYANKGTSIINRDGGSIINNDEYLKDKYLIIKDKHIISNYDFLLVNNVFYKDDELKHGDIIYYLGVEIHYYKDFLYINSFNLIFNIKSAYLKEKVYLFKPSRVKISHYYKRNYSDVVLDKLMPFNPPKKTNDKKIIYQIGPSLTMSMAMFSLSGINIYNSYLSNGFTFSLIALGIMPITIMLSGVLWPILNKSSENRKYKKEYTKQKDKYLKYLESFENKALKEIERFINDENYYAFNVDNIQSKLFYVNKNSAAFLNINLGHYYKELDFDYDKTIDDEINEKLFNIKRKISSIGNAQLFIDLKKDKRVSIVSDNKKYYLLRILLELAYKYSPDDLIIAVYTKDKEIKYLIYNLLHLYVGKFRLMFDEERDLIKLNSIDQKRKIVLLSDEPLSYLGKEIIVIDIVSDLKDILKYSDVVIEDFGITSYLNAKREQMFEITKEKIDFGKYFDYLSNLENKNLNNKVLRFLDSSEQINEIQNNYLNHDNGLKAQFAYVDNKLIEFDIHESKDGPHGLIGGSTGSGKSELIISFLLSLVLRYPPDYLNIILIDYKGGGIKESLTVDNKTIPHIVASVNNLEEGTFERLIVAIDFELKKRQLLFKELSNASANSIMSLDDYLLIYKEFNFKPLSHLLIVVDEFAELKKENPEVIKELISFSRIGRSLGVHLILATQKPGGVIDEEIWSNSRFKIGLKVNNERDSEDIIKSKYAYYLSNPGEFYLKVDNIIKKGISIYSKTDVNNNDKFEIGILNNQLEYVYKKTIRNNKPLYESTYICLKIIETTINLNIKTEKISYKKPPSVSLAQLNKNDVNYIHFGLIDDYLKAKKGILKYSINENMFIYSNRKNEFNNLIYELNFSKRKTVLISDKKISSYYICDCINYIDGEDLIYLFNKLLNDRTSNITILIEDINSLISYDEIYQDYLLKLIRRQNSANYNFIVLSSISSINFKLLNSFKNKLAIEINNQQDLSNLFGQKGKAIAKSYFYLDTPIPFVPCKIEKLENTNSIINSFLDPIPQIILNEKTVNETFIGYLQDSRLKYYVKDKEKLLITGYDLDLIENYKKIYSKENIIVKGYEDSFVLDKYENIIWVGESIYNQRLFYPDRNVDLSKGQGYLYKNGKGRKIKLITYESDNTTLWNCL